jgi:hypothetical protein
VSNFTDSVPRTRTANGSVELTVRISLNPSGMAHLNGRWVMRDDLQVIGNLTELLREARRGLG